MMGSKLTAEVDVVIVGARCAGSTLACFLRRAGASVLVLERARLASEHVLSTHTLHPPGTAVIDELGLGAALRSEAPAMRELRLEKDGGCVELQLSPEQAEYCPRRARFDGLLQRAAVEAGAELRERTQVSDLLRDGERVIGVCATGPDGRAYVVRAGLVVGADGRNSTIAALVHSDEYQGYDAPRAMFWGYFPAPRDYRPLMQIAFDRGEIRVAFATERGEVLLGCLPDVRAAGSFKASPLEALRANLAARSELAELARTEPSEPIRGIVSARYFLRRAVGPGWALVGDAGMHKEYLSGDGMSEALVQAKRLAAAIAQGGEAALEHFWHDRDARALPRFCFYRDQGTSGARPAVEGLGLSHINRSAELKRRLAASLSHDLSPYEVASPAQALRWLAGALARGQVRMVREFAALARRSAEVQRWTRAAEARAARAQPGFDVRRLNSARAVA